MSTSRRWDRREFLATSAASVAVLALAAPRLVPSLLAGEASRPPVGAECPWTTYPASQMQTNGMKVAPEYAPYLVQMESTAQRCVGLANPGEYAEFTAAAAANAIVVRYAIPDTRDGAGQDSSLELFCNGKLVRMLPLTSRYSWRYGAYPFTNNPNDGRPRNFYDEVRAAGLRIAKGDRIRLQRPAGTAAACILDLADLEMAPPPLARPSDSLSLLDFVAHAGGRGDVTEPLRRLVAEAARQKKIAWVPAGEYLLTGDIPLVSGVTLQGAGMWHTVFLGDANLYAKPNRRLRFVLTGTDIHLADFALTGRLNYRIDNEQNDGIFGAHASHSTVSRLWIEHTKVGMWFYVCDHITVDSCRLRNTLADGINFCVDVRDSVMQNCAARGTGDDCYAIWPAASDQSFVQQAPNPGNNVIRRCTGELPSLAQGAAIYGGADNRIEDCRFTDIASGCGILISTTFPTSGGKFDNNFSGQTVVRNCELVRCGGFDQGWTWRAALQIALDRRSISGLRISGIILRDSLSDAIGIVSPPNAAAGLSLTDTHFEEIECSGFGLGPKGRHGLWVQEGIHGEASLLHSSLADYKIDSRHFKLTRG